MRTKASPSPSPSPPLARPCSPDRTLWFPTLQGGPQRHRKPHTEPWPAMAKQLQLLWHAFNRTLERLLPFTWISRANHYLFSNRECLSHPHNQHAQPGVVMLRRKPNQARYNDISNYAVMTRRKLFPKSKSHHPLFATPRT